MALDRIVNDTLLPGHILLKPAFFFTKKLSLSFKGYEKLNTIFWLFVNIVLLPITLLSSFLGFTAKSCLHFAGYSTQRRELVVAEVNPSQEWYDGVGATMKLWEAQAINNKKGTKIQSESDVFHSAMMLSKLIANCMEKPSLHTDRFEKIIICRDVAFKEIQSVALIKEVTGKHNKRKIIKLSYLVTNPQNIRLEINNKIYTRVEGAGKAIIDFLSTKAKIQGYWGIFLESVTSAKPFYNKLGFQDYSSSEVIRQDTDCHPMLLLT